MKNHKKMCLYKHYNEIILMKVNIQIKRQQKYIRFGHKL